MSEIATIETLLRKMVLTDFEGEMHAAAKAIRHKVRTGRIDAHALTLSVGPVAAAAAASPSPPPPPPQASAQPVQKSFFKRWVTGCLVVGAIYVINFELRTSPAPLKTISIVEDTVAKPGQGYDVDGFFWPDRSNQKVFEDRIGLRTLQECRAWAYSKYQEINDPKGVRSDHTCALGRVQHADGRIQYTRGLTR